MVWVLLSTLTLLGVSSCDGSGCCEGKVNKKDLTDKVSGCLFVLIGLPSCGGGG